MKRPLVIVALVYVAGLGAGSFLRLPPVLIFVAIALIVASQGAMLFRRRRAVDLLLFAAVFLIGVLQQYRIESQNRSAREILERFDDGEVVRLTGRLASTDRVYKTRRTFRLEDCILDGGESPAVHFPTAIQLVCGGAAFDAVGDRPPRPGDRVAATGRLRRPPDLSNPDVFNYRAYLEQRGIGASLYVRRPGEVTFSPPARMRSPIEWLIGVGEQLRRAVETILDRELEPGTARLVRSVLLGQANRLDLESRRNFIRCGLAHIFAVSGLHVGILLMVLDALVRLLGLRPSWRSVVLILALWLYCPIVGFRPSAVRATIIFSTLLASHLFRYKVEHLTALAAAALAILVANPRALSQAGFQLSFVCMLSIILLAPPLNQWLRMNDEKGTARWPRLAGWTNRYVLSCFTIILAAQAGLLPFLAHYYHLVPALGVLSNLLILYLVWLLFAAAFLLIGAASLVPALAFAAAGALNLFSHTILGLLQFWSTLPLVSIQTPGWPVYASVAYYILLFGWVVLPHEPSPFFMAKQRARFLIGGAAIVAWVIWAPAVLGVGGAGLRATFLDVGQGDSCVLEMPGGPVILIDGGDSRLHAGRYVVVPFLEARGIDRLDAVIATHPDSDHIGGLPAVFDRLEVARFIEGPGRRSTNAYRRLESAVEAEHARRDTVFSGDWLEAPMGARVLFLHPPRGAVYSNLNDSSLILMVDWGECEILMPGDIERAAERDLLASRADLACDVLKVAHHGSAKATSRRFLERAHPALAVISCGRGNPYGHPRPEVLDRLTSAGVTIARTDEDGAVTVRCNGRSIIWRTEKKNARTR